MSFKNNPILSILVLLQLLCAGFFAYELAASIQDSRSGIRIADVRSYIEVFAIIGLLLGSAFGLRAVSFATQKQKAAEDALRVASGAFHTVVEEKFQLWKLTKSEADVAWFAIKGFNIAEIASLRGSSEGTIKAQSNSIYRKVGVSGRSQLLSLLLEDLLEVSNEAK